MKGAEQADGYVRQPCRQGSQRPRRCTQPHSAHNNATPPTLQDVGSRIVNEEVGVRELFKRACQRPREGPQVLIIARARLQLHPLVDGLRDNTRRNVLGFGGEGDAHLCRAPSVVAADKAHTLPPKHASLQAHPLGLCVPGVGPAVVHVNYIDLLRLAKVQLAALHAVALRGAGSAAGMRAGTQQA